MMKEKKGWQIILFLFLFVVIAIGVFPVVSTGEGNGSSDNNYNDVYGVTKEIKFSFVSDNDTYERYVWMAVPKSVENNYNIDDIHFEPEPFNEYTDSYGNKIVKWDTDKAPSSEYVVIFNYQKLYNQKEIDDAKIKPYTGDDSEILKYLEPSKYVQSNSQKLIDEVENSIVAPYRTSTKNNIENILAWTNRNISPGGGKTDALSAYESRTGECGGYSNLIIAFARIIGVPAREVCGIKRLSPGEHVFRGGVEHTLGTHCWVEFYFEDYGWIQCESTLFDSNNYSFEEATSFQEERLVLSVADVEIGDRLIDWFHIPWVGNNDYKGQGEGFPYAFYMNVSIADAPPSDDPPDDPEDEKSSSSSGGCFVKTLKSD